MNVFELDFFINLILFHIYGSLLNKDNLFMKLSLRLNFIVTDIPFTAFYFLIQMCSYVFHILWIGSNMEQNPTELETV